MSFPHADLNARGTAVYHLLVIFDILPSSSSKVSADQLLKITSAGSFSKCEVWPMTPDERRKTVSASWMLINRCVIDKSKSADFGSLDYSNTFVHTVFASQPESSCVGLAFLGWLTAWDFAQKFQENVLSSCVVRMYMPLFLLLIQQLYDALDIVK